MAKDEIVVTYYYMPVSGGVLEKHIDDKTGEIIKSKTQTGKVGDPYSTSPEDIEGYDLVESKKPENAKGTMTEKQTVVEYRYIRKAKVIVEYIDKTTGEKLMEVDKDTKAEKVSTVEIDGHEGDPYETVEKAFEKYEIVQEDYPQNSKGEMKVTRNPDGTVDIVTYVRYYYIYTQSSVVVEYKDAMTGEVLSESTTIPGKDGDSYNTKPKDIEGYDLVEQLSENTSGTMKKEQIVAKYYYVKKSKVIVQYLEKGTNTKLSDEIIINGHEGDVYTTANKNIEGFRFVESTDNTSGKMQKTDIMVFYYYEYVGTGPVDRLERNVKNILPYTRERLKGALNLLPLTGDKVELVIAIMTLTVLANIIQMKYSSRNKVHTKAKHTRKPMRRDLKVDLIRIEHYKSGKRRKMRNGRGKRAK